MDTPFPFGFAFSTGFYLTAYVLTLAIHVVFMNYVLAGAAYLAIASLGSADAERESGGQTAAAVLRDWMPFALSAAITAGVAPLLFVQILYQGSFYTANLLLFHRWMSILPVLIAGFYLFYLLKSERAQRWTRAPRIAAGFGAFACVAFTGYSWAENHVLSQHPEVWPSFYEAGLMHYRSSEIPRRLAVWITGSIATMVTLVSWQMLVSERRGSTLAPGAPRCAALLALAGIVLSTLCGSLYYLFADPARRGALTGALAGPYVIAAGVGLVAQLAAWIAQARLGRFQFPWLVLASAGLLVTILGATVGREAIRLSVLDVAAHQARHEQAAAVRGLPVFLVCFVLNAGLIGWCLVLVRKRASAAHNK